MAKHVRPRDMHRQTTQTSGMTRAESFHTDRLWAGLAFTDPGVVSGWHHHGEHETAIYVRTGHFRFETGPGGRTVLDGRPGDFIYVAPGEIHRESNTGGERSEAIVVRSGTGEVVINVNGPERE